MNVRDLALIETVPVAYLSTIDKNGYPCTRGMLNLRCKSKYPGIANLFNDNDNKTILYFTTNSSSKKVRELMENGKAAAYFCHPEEWHGILLQGDLEVIHDNSLKDAMWQNGWEMYYKEGKGSADYTILKLTAASFRSYYQLQRVEKVLA